MKHRNWPAIGASLFLCATLFSPLPATAKSDPGKTTVSAKAKNTSSAKTNKKKASKQAAARAEANKSAKQQAKADKNKSSRQAASVDSSKSDKKTATEANDRAIWMKRAKFSEALSGKASWYGKDFHNKATASGLAYDMHTFTAAHRTLPIGTVVKVTDQNNGKSVMVCVTDRGPFVRGRVIDVSYAAADKLGLHKRGVSNVKLEVVSDENGAPLKKDKAYFVKYASGNGKNKVGPFNAFADAAAMHEALRQAHPEAEVILDNNQK